MFERTLAQYPDIAGQIKTLAEKRVRGQGSG